MPTVSSRNRLSLDDICVFEEDSKNFGMGEIGLVGLPFFIEDMLRGMDRHLPN